MMLCRQRRAGPSCIPFVQFLQRLHVFLAEIEVEDVKIVADSYWRNALRDDDQPQLQAESDQNLEGVGS